MKKNRRWAMRMKEDMMRAYESGKEGHDIALKYSFEETFGDPVELTTPLSVKEALLTASRAVVALSSYEDGDVDKLLFTCSGTVLKGVNAGDRVFVITSASLIRPAQTDLTRLKIKVQMGNGQICVGHLYGHDWHLNIAVISFRTPNAALIHGLDMTPFSPCAQSNEEVFALGLQYSSGQFMSSKGNLVVKSAQKFDCEVLIYSSCKITKCGIGGPLIDDSGNWIGVNFFDDEETPFLPTFLVTKLWNHLKRFKRVNHPWLGVKLRALVTMADVEHMKIYQKIHDMYGLMVDKVEEGSPAAQSGIQEGVILSEIDGVKLFSVAQLVATLLEIKDVSLKDAEEAGDVGNIIVKGVVFKEIEGGTSFFKDIILGELEENRHCSWPVPDVYPYMKRSLRRDVLRLDDRGFLLDDRGCRRLKQFGDNYV